MSGNLKMKVRTDGQGCYWVDIVTEDGGHCVASCGAGSESKELSCLFASAPDLLEACRELVDVVGLAMYAIEGVGHDVFWDALDRADIKRGFTERANAVIAKAEGRDL